MNRICNACAHDKICMTIWLNLKNKRSFRQTHSAAENKLAPRSYDAGHTAAWQTDGRTDRIAVSISRVSNAVLTRVAQWKVREKIRRGLWRINRWLMQYRDYSGGLRYTRVFTEITGMFANNCNSCNDFWTSFFKEK